MNMQIAEWHLYNLLGLKSIHANSRQIHLAYARSLQHGVAPYAELTRAFVVLTDQHLKHIYDVHGELGLWYYQAKIADREFHWMQHRRFRYESVPAKQKVGKRRRSKKRCCLKGGKGNMKSKRAAVQRDVKKDVGWDAADQAWGSVIKNKPHVEAIQVALADLRMKESSGENLTKASGSEVSLQVKPEDAPKNNLPWLPNLTKAWLIAAFDQNKPATVNPVPSDFPRSDTGGVISL